MARLRSLWSMPLAIALLTAATAVLTLRSHGYTHLVIALVSLTVVVGVGLNILLGLAGQISFGHVGFYAIGAYTVAILTNHDVSFWIAFPLAGILAAAVGFLLALPALRVAGPYLAMVTIAFAFIVQHATIEWRGLTGGANGIIGLQPPAIGAFVFAERDTALLAVALAGLSLLLFHRIAGSGWGKGMIAVRDSEIAAGSIGLNPVTIKTMAFVLSAAFAGLAGAIFTPLLMFVAPDSFPFSQSILFLLAVIVGGAGSTLGPVIGAAVSVVLPETLSGLAEYRLLFFGALLLVVLWLAPEGVIGTLRRVLPRLGPAPARPQGGSVAALLGRSDIRPSLEISGIGIQFGGVHAAQGVVFTARPGEVTSLIGPNGAGKTTVLNIISGFYRPDAGSIRLGSSELAGASAWRVARAGVARTYQTTRLFGSMSVIDNVLTAQRRGRLGSPLSRAADAQDLANAAALLDFVGYRGDLDTLAAELPHIDRRLVEIARALATAPSILLLDEPAAGLMPSDKAALSTLLRAIADLGIAVVLVEHDMPLVMGISDRITVLDAGRVIAEGTPHQVRSDPAVLKAYLGDSSMRERPRKGAAPGREPVLTVLRLTAGYGAAPVVEDLSFDVHEGEFAALLGANGAGKSTTMRVLAGLLPAQAGEIVLANERIDGLDAHRIARRGIALVPEGRQVFPELSVRDNLALGAHSRPKADVDAEIEAVLARFPRLRERIGSRAGLLSGGEQQMLAVGRGLMAQPRVLLLDEPSLGLAPAIINELFDILAELRDDGRTILLVDQMAALALSVADRGFVIESGRLVQSGSTEALRQDARLEAAYLGKAERIAS